MYVIYLCNKMYDNNALSHGNDEQKHICYISTNQ